MQNTGKIGRSCEAELQVRLRETPAVVMLGPRQCGKSTLARTLLKAWPEAVYLDLERPAEARQLTDPELFLDTCRGRLLCLDEIQRQPELFPVLRSHIDRESRNGQFLLLGSASPELLRQTSETLAGRISYLELTPFRVPEVSAAAGYALAAHWWRGGFPRSYLAPSDAASRRWREDFVRTFLERDLPQLGIRVPALTLHRLWQMCAHHHGQVVNVSRLGEALGFSHTSVRHYLDAFCQTFMLRLLPPFEANLKKRLIRAPKLYLRDPGILHALLEIDSYRRLLGHPVSGASWEGWVIEQVLAQLPDWHGSFYRTSDGTEIDLVLERGGRRLVLECKASEAPKVGAGFHHSLAALEPEQALIVAPIPGAAYPLGANVTVCSLPQALQLLTRLAAAA